MKNTFALLFTFIFILSLAATAQDTGQLQVGVLNLTPPSPTMMALAKYGDTPVGYYTGTANISIPLYEVKTNDFSLPISLSYQGGGIKVEEAASWVGLGWSLNAGGIISRSARGFQDESGYLSYASPRVRDVIAMTGSTQDDFLRDANMAHYDLEPDMFFFNFGQHSGKFFFDQDIKKFVTVPHSAMAFDTTSIMTLPHVWHLTTEDGAQYFFDKKETNYSTSQCDGNAGSLNKATTGWFLTRVVTPIARDTIKFLYDSVFYSTQAINNVTKNTPTFLSVLPSCVKQRTICYSQNIYKGLRLSSIVHPRGKINFLSTNNRYDLVGDLMLDEIDIYNFDDTVPFKKFILGHNYFNNSLATGTITDENSYLVRLKLTSVTEVGSAGSELPPYLFSYNESTAMPSRLSFAQDNWGYYNGANGNADLVPPYIPPTGTAIPFYLDGANRRVNPVYTGLGVLTKLVYPTGGWTTYSYENHTNSYYVDYSYNANYVNRHALLDATMPCAGSASHIYCRSITVDHHLYAGVFANVQVEGVLNCAYCTSQNPCAQLYLTNATTAIPICNQDNFYIPNGTYTLTADFSQNLTPTDYEDFSIYITWEEYTDTTELPFIIGGLRLHRIQDNDGMNNTKTKYFDYNNSGSVVSNMPVYTYNLPCAHDAETAGDNRSNDFTARTSTSNLPLGTTQGSPVGYNLVTVSSDSLGYFGKTDFQYNTADDDVIAANNGGASSSTLGGIGVGYYPFPPATSFDHRRGLLMKQEDYKWNNSTWQLIRSVSNVYDPLSIPGESVTNTDPWTFDGSRVTMGIKTAPFGILSFAIPFAVASFYKNITEWVRHVSSTEVTFDDDGNSMTTVTNMTYNNFKNLMPSITQKTLSDGTIKRIYARYPTDYFLGSPTVDYPLLGLNHLVTNNIVSSPVEVYETIQRSGSTENFARAIYHIYDASYSLPDEIKQLETALPINSSVDDSWASSQSYDSGGTVYYRFIGAVTYKSRIKFNKYDPVTGNLLQQQKTRDVPQTYLWGYKNSYVTAEVHNAAWNQVYYNSFEDDGSAFTDGSGVNQSKTGRKVYNSASFTIPTSFAPTASNLVLTYWYWSSRSPGLLLHGRSLHQERKSTRCVSVPPIRL